MSDNVAHYIPIFSMYRKLPHPRSAVKTNLMSLCSRNPEESLLRQNTVMGVGTNVSTNRAIAVQAKARPLGDGSEYVSTGGGCFNPMISVSAANIIHPGQVNIPKGIRDPNTP